MTPLTQEVLSTSALAYLSLEPFNVGHLLLLGGCFGVPRAVLCIFLQAYLDALSAVL